MELLRKEMERVGLNNSRGNNNNNNNDDNNNSNKNKEHQTREGKEQEIIMNGSDKNSNNKEQQKTMLRTPADIFDHPSFYSFVLDMPGLDAQNIKVKVEKGVLHVTGKKKKQQMGDGVKVLRVERRRARYMRKFTLPADASQEDVKATYKDGVLSITVSKIPPQHQQVELSDSTSPTSTITATTTDNDVSIS